MGETPSHLDREKMQQVILFFLERINNVHLGRTKLMKLLYYVDFDHYEKYGNAVTGAKYRALPHGPVPDKADKVIAKMIADGLVKPVKMPVGPYEQDRLITEAIFNVSKFSGDEIEVMEKVACAWENATAKEIEAASHRESPWAATQAQKTIDYELAAYRTPLPPDEFDELLAGSDRVKKFLQSAH